jgi:glycosyltransferase involved in cell wall biosynthesis
MLAQALDGVTSQVLNGKYSFEVVVVDNDSNRSAQSVIKHFQENNMLKIVYDCEPEQNIALARNKAIKIANGNIIAFIDDDEYPEKDWLCTIYTCLLKYEADAVLGPVLPAFQPGAPEWLKKSKLCKRNRNPTGNPISKRDMRTGNILLKRHIFEEDKNWFDQDRGRTGGEDGEFIGRQIRKGRKFVWCDEAIVFETIPPGRLSLSYYIKKEFRIGTVFGKKLRGKQSYVTAIKMTILLIGYAVVFPIFLIRKKHIWSSIVCKIAYNIGGVLSFIGVAKPLPR